MLPFEFNPEKELRNLDGKVVFLTGGPYTPLFYLIQVPS